MTAPMYDRVEAAMRELREQQRRLQEVQNQLASEGVSVTSRDHMVTVTLDARGEVSGITFHSTKFRRMAPAELGSVITQTIRQARQRAMEQVIAAYQDFLPSPIDLRKVLNGDFDLDQMISDAVRMASEPIPGEKPTRPSDAKETHHG